MSHQLILWFCQTAHLLAAACDALYQLWTGLSLYAFPLIPLLEKVLVKISDNQVEEVIIITPSWQRRSRYFLLQMACEIPLLLPSRRDLRSQYLYNKGMLFHTDLKTHRFTVWKLSSVPSRIEVFQRQISKRSSLPLETQLEQCTKAGGKLLLAGVAKGVKIPFASF